MTTLVFFLEEPSAEECLKGVLPRILPAGIVTRYIVFQGKQDLEKQIVRRLMGWLTPNTKFVVLRDQDSGNCIAIKDELREKCQQARRPGVLVPIACHELESWYLGDLQRVGRGLSIRGLASRQNSKKFRCPDHLPNAADELKEITKERYSKVNGSRQLGPHLNFESNRSTSFRVFIEGVKRLIDDSVDA